MERFRPIRKKLKSLLAEDNVEHPVVKG